jgi:SdrD B-like domain/SprB repeat/Secretion system C-terminal sorting domain
MRSMFYKIETKFFSLFALLLLSSSLIAQLQVNTINTNLSCFAVCNGSSTASVAGGTTPYSYSWSTGSTAATITGLCASTYTVTVTDATGATASKSAAITQPNQLTVNAAGTDQICGLNPSGTATATPANGTAPYAYTWSTGATTAQITGLVAGNYTVTTTDSRGCTAAASATVIFSNEGIWMMDSVADVRCNGQNNGYLSVSPMSGSAPYTYLWSNGGTTKSISGLSVGVYTVTVTEAGGCSATRTFQIAQPAVLSVATTNTNANCGPTGSATATASGGNGTYTFTWSNGATGATATGLAAGTYTVSTSDSKGCGAAKTVTIQNTGGALAATALLTTAPGCTSNGTITASGVGGSGNYTFSWSNGSNTASASVAAGVYIVTVTDATSGCTGTSSITVQAPAVPALTTSVTTQATCSTGGVAVVAISNGNAPYTYLWDNGQTTASATNLSGGTRSVTVTNAAGCSATATVIIAQPQAPSVSINVTAQPSCTVSTGSATATVTGGVSPYTYLWTGGATTASASNLAAGTATVTVTDANGCASNTSASITSTSSPVSVTIQQLAPGNCTTGGSIQAFPTGNAGPFTYGWTGPNAGPFPGFNVSALGGTYTVTVTGAGGCTGTATIVVPATNTLAAGINKIGTSTCAGQQMEAIVGGGVAPFTYQWAGPGSTGTNSTFFAQLSGGYNLTVTGSNGCSSVGNTIVSLPAAPTVTISASSNATCSLGGAATAAAANGVGPYTYAWSNGATGATASGLAGGAYTVTTTAANGCTNTTSVTIGFVNNGVQVGDYVWSDIDQDGFQETGEAPQPNIYVMLMSAGPDGMFGTADDVTVARDTTNAAGKYLFDCVTPGTYVIMFSNLPAGYQWAAKDNVNNDCLDSDANAAGKTAPFTILAGGGNNLCIDAGLHVLCSNVTFAGTIGNDQTICEGETPATITPNGPPVGGTGAFEFVWMTLDKSGMVPTWVGIPNTNSASYNPGPLFTTSHYMRCIRRAGCVTFLESNIVTITVKAAGSPGCTQFLTSFIVGSAPSQSIAVEWTVPYEMPNLKYILQHSQDQINWAHVYDVFGAPSGSNTPITYKYTHMIPQMGDNYYRVLRVTQANDLSYSDTKKFNMHIEPLTVYPNPSLSSAQIFMRNNMAMTDGLTVELFDVNGRLMSSTEILKDQFGDVALPVLNLNAGVYYIRVKLDGKPVQTTELMRY